ncbi:MAG: zinc-ribbon domain-containing protein [Myxococcota bacterium]|nr:zinc-ribbon domain-containing protein [Myxococcota bacterium]
MQIACEKCSTTYSLDEKLLPPGGAPVQCTRCGHVFIALSAADERRERSGTQIFGVKAPAGLPDDVEDEDEERSGNTQIFGRVPPPPPAAPRPTTQMFGAVGAPATPPAPPEQRSSTQMFGAVKAPAAVPPAQPEQRSSTQMFGAVGAPAAPPAQPEQRSSTQMFGAVAAPTQPRSPTAMFGAVQPGGSSPSLPKITFGGEAVVAHPPPETTQGDAPAAFPLSDPRDIDPAMASTQQMKASELAKAMAAYRSAEVTRLPAGGAIPPGAEPLELQTRAPRSGMTAELQLGGQHLPPRPGMTAELQLGGQHLPPRPGMTAELQLGGQHLPPPPGMTAELQMGGQHLPPRPGMTAELHLDAPRARPSSPGYARVELPPEAPELEQFESPEEGSAAARKSSLPLFLGVLGLLAVAGVGYLLLANRAPSVPPAAAAAREAAVVLLRRDDPASRRRSIEELQRVLAQHPTYLEAQADLVSALAIQLDDTRAQQERALGEVRVLEKEIERLTNAQSPSDWQNRVYVLSDEVAKLRTEGPQLQESVNGYDRRLRQEYERLEVAVAARKKLDPSAISIHQRAQGLYGSVMPSEETLTALQTYEATGSTEGWGKVALAQFVLNSRSSTDVVNRGRNAIEELVEADSSFIRPYVLAARIAIRQERYEAAVTMLEAAVALNPEHQAAQDLLEWALASQRAAEASP